MKQRMVKKILTTLSEHWDRQHKFVVREGRVIFKIKPYRRVTQQRWFAELKKRGLILTAKERKEEGNA